MAKKNIKTTQAKANTKQGPAPAPARAEKAPAENIFVRGDRQLIYDRKSFLIFGAGLGLVLLGLLLMAGSAMPDPERWEPERIYSFRRITLAPLSMVLGFGVLIYGIFAGGATATKSDENPGAEQA